MRIPDIPDAVITAVETRAAVNEANDLTRFPWEQGLFGMSYFVHRRNQKCTT